MSDRPILFSGPMVRAILEGRKTQTRRLVKPMLSRENDGEIGTAWYMSHRSFPSLRGPVVNVSVPGGYKPVSIAPPFAVCDLLWVRETWAGNLPGCEEQRGYSYRADHMDPRGDGPVRIKWKSPLFMPREASRISLRVLAVRPERLQDISEEDAVAEGVTVDEAWAQHGGDHRDSFAILWDSLNAKRRERQWVANPWVWAVTFERLLDGVLHDQFPGVKP